MDTDIFFVYIKIDDMYKDISEDVETWFNTSNSELYRPLPKGKNKISNWINDRWIGWKNHHKICWNKSKNLIDDGSEDKKDKRHKKSVS